MKLLFKCLLLLPFLAIAQPCELGYELNGTNDYIKIPNTTNINTNNTAVSNRTIETWFKVDNITTRQVLYEEGGAGTAIILYIEGGRVYCGAYKSNGSLAEYFRSANGDINNNNWNHIAFIISTSGSTTTFSWYLNGVLQDNQIGFNIPKHTGDIQIGRNAKLRYPNCATWSVSSLTGSNSEHCTNTVTASNNTKYYFDGNIWGFRIWNSARTTAQINNNINNELTSGTNLVAYLDDDTVEYLNNSGNWATASANGNPTIYTWLEFAISNDWNNIGNWSGGVVPLTTKLQKVVIPASLNPPLITSEIRIGKLDLSNSNSKITIQDGGTLNVYYDVTNSGIITVNNNGSFILQDNEAISGSGSFIIERDTPEYPDNNYFSIWSSPVIEANSEIGNTFANSISSYVYDASQNPSAYVGVPITDKMKVGKGYFIRSRDAAGVVTRTFNGLANNGCLNQTIFYNNSEDFYNLLGNPYPSAIDWLSFYNDNSSVIGGTMYYWNQSYVGINNLVSDYISFNSTGSNVFGTTGDIATANGFFVEALQPGTVTFKNSHRIIGNNAQFFRNNNTITNNEGKSWFKLSGDDGYESVLIGFIPDASNDYETNYDARFFNEGSSIEFYSLIEAQKFAIQGRSQLEADQDIEIPLGFQVTKSGNYTISIDQEFIDSSFDIYLEDKLENSFTDLRAIDYTFSLTNPTEENNRFSLHYSSITLNVGEAESYKSNTIRAYFLNNKLVTNINNDSLVEPIKIELFDITGKKILNIDYNKTIFTGKSLSSGIYIVNYVFEDLSKVSKKLFKE